MATTLRYGLRTPDGTAPNNYPGHMLQLAQDIEGRLGAVDDATTRPAVSASSGAQAIGSPAYLTFGTLQYATGNAWSPTSNFVATRAGLYLCQLTVNAAAGSEQTPVQIVLTHYARGTGGVLEQRTFPVGARSTCAAVLQLTAGEFVNWWLSPGASSYSTSSAFADFTHLGVLA